jgi:hypothetical protein
MPKCEQCGTKITFLEILKYGNNPYCKPCTDAVEAQRQVAILEQQIIEQEKQQIQIHTKRAEVLGLDSMAQMAQYMLNQQSLKLEELLEIKKKQLYWLRIVGVFYLLALIGGILIALGVRP